MQIQRFFAALRMTYFLAMRSRLGGELGFGFGFGGFGRADEALIGAFGRGGNLGGLAFFGATLGEKVAVVWADEIGAFPVGVLKQVSGIAVGAGLVDEFEVGGEVALGVVGAAVEDVAALSFADGEVASVLGAFDV